MLSLVNRDARRARVRGPAFEVFGTSNPERRTWDPVFRSSPAFPVTLAIMSRDAILANDLYAHNATAVSGPGRQIHLVDLVHLVCFVHLVGLV